MALYETEFSKFPNTKITLHNFQNVDDEIAEIVNEIDMARNAGKYQEAQNLIHKYADKLKQYVVDAATFRTWEEEIYNAQVYAKQVQQTIYFEEEAPDCCENDVWITGGDYGAV